MVAQTFLNILAACVGFLSAIFFALGTLKLKHKEIADIASTWWDFNKHLADSIADQRADYIVGALLLVLSFSLQLTANLVSPTFELSLLQPAGAATAEIVALITALLLVSVLIRNAVAKSTKLAVQALLEQSTRQDAPKP